jgi:hypothetical protein
MEKSASLAVLEELVKQSGGKSAVKESMKFGSIQIEFTLKRSLSLPERSAFVNGVAQGVFVNDIYIPEDVEAFKNISFYRIFTDLYVPTEESGGETLLNISKAYDFCNALNLVEYCCKKHPDVKSLYEDLCECADKQIEFKKSQILSQERYALSKAEAQMKSVSEQLDAASDQIEALFGTFKGDDLAAAMNAISGLDMKSLNKILSNR